MAEDAISALLRQSGVAFVATVERIGATTMSDVPVSDHTVVVRVDDVLDAPASLGHLAGHEVTVVIAQPVSVGQQLALFTNVAVLGKGVAVSEVGRLPATDVQPHIAGAGAGPMAIAGGSTAGSGLQPLAAVRRQQRANDLRAHAAEGDVVVVGRVIRLEQVGQERYSEHAPHYWRATLQVQHVERGNVSGQEVSFIYPASQDVQWVDAPKPEPRQQGMWILHATTGAESRLAPFACLHADDYRPVQQIESLRQTTP